MSKWSRDSDELEQRIARMFIVDEFGEVDGLEWIGRTSRADTRYHEDCQ